MTAQRGWVNFSSRLFVAKDLEMRGIEPRAFHMQSERSTTELHPLLYNATEIIMGMSKIVLPTGGLEPPIFGLGDRRLIH